MIINTGGRTDTVQYYTEWLLNRYSEGYVLSRPGGRKSREERMPRDFCAFSVANNRCPKRRSRK